MMAYAEIQPDDLRARMERGEDPCVLDVREPYEVTEWAFPGAICIPLGDLAARAAELPTDREIVVICHSGVRSAAAAEALDRAGWSAANLAGGVLAWQATAGG
jgi:rhodanese-related sulfurtransferase